jgi:histidyl-tRNA synthetase
MRFQVLPGFRDFYPEQLAVRRAIESAWHRASLGAGFQEIDGPVLESLELLTAKSGDEIMGQLYAFTDKGGREVSLRPEMTPTLARMVAARAGGLPKPIKWYCVPEFYRYEKPQRGRLRAFHQWNADVVGSAEPAADAEAISVAIQALRILGLGLERDPEVRGRLEEKLGGTRAKELLGWCERMPVERAEELGELLEACRDFGLDGFVEPDFKIVRGLAYYTGPVWEIFDRGRSLRAVAGGGRYDQLIASLGGPDLPALGFGMGDVVLRELLDERGLLPVAPARVEAYVVPIGAGQVSAARQVVARLRARGVAVDAPYGAPKIGKALKQADAAGARRAVIVGPDEWARGAVKIKDLASGEEREVAVDELE